MPPIEHNLLGGNPRIDERGVEGMPRAAEPIVCRVDRERRRKSEQIDTAGEGAEAGVVKPDQILMVGGKSLVVLRAHSTPEIEPDHSVAASLAALTQTSTPETASITAPAVTSLPFDYKGSAPEDDEKADETKEPGS